MIERADQWTPPDSLGYSSLRPVRLTSQGQSPDRAGRGLCHRSRGAGCLSGTQGPARGGGEDTPPRSGHRRRCRRHSCLARRRKRQRTSRHLPLRIWRPDLLPLRRDSRQHMAHSGAGRSSAGTLCPVEARNQPPRSLALERSFRSGFPTSLPPWSPFPRSCCRSLCDARPACSPKAGPRPAGSPDSRKPTSADPRPIRIPPAQWRPRQRQGQQVQTSGRRSVALCPLRPRKSSAQRALPVVTRPAGKRSQYRKNIAADERRSTLMKNKCCHRRLSALGIVHSCPAPWSGAAIGGA